VNSYNKNKTKNKIKSETDLIEKIAKRIKTPPHLPNEFVGIGDDCSFFKISENRYALFTTDISIENRHFIISKSSPLEIGYKAMISNVSDISAMGGRPICAFISLGITGGINAINEDFILKLYDGMNKALQPTNCIISGGDISKSNELIISITIYGESHRHPIMRHGALAGDNIYVTGSLGGAKAGLDFVLENSKFSPEFNVLLKRHNCPPNRNNMVDILCENYEVTSMIDISDGLLLDLSRIAEKSKCGFILYPNKIKPHKKLKEYCKKFKYDINEYTLYSGEEYELLFTGKAKIEHPDITQIGVITKDGFFLNIDDKLIPTDVRGFDHFS
jgi:thiamine-monophosphate kinase